MLRQAEGYTRRANQERIALAAMTWRITGRATTQPTWIAMVDRHVGYWHF
ncbi:MAG: hypothetical protein JWQ89_1674 [Devosia sp.]|nr:hypothetical protein [Devosia sp.]